MRKVILSYSYFVVVVALVHGPANLTAFANIEKVDAEYGKSWIIMPDGQGQPQVAILSDDVEEITARGLFDAPTVETVKFCLYTSKSPAKCKRLETGKKDLLKLSGINSGVPTKVVTHGWKSSGRSPTCLHIKDAYLSKGDYNVLIVDWEKIADQHYCFAAEDTARVATHTAKLIDFLMASAALRAEDIHLIGHSLGAHISGMTGKRITAGPIARITGLDPALPLFGPSETFFNRVRLNKDQANFVDVIHTCGGVLGVFSGLGHADFYPNGGTPGQPGCGNLKEIIESCSHGRAWEYFAESINSSIPFMTKRCKGWQLFYRQEDECEITGIPMGDPTLSNARGIFYLETHDKKPYAIA